MFKFHNNLLPSSFDTFFTPVENIHSYDTKSAANQSHSLPRARTNYATFNIRFQGPKVWNYLGKNVKSTYLNKFKENLKQEFLSQYYVLIDRVGGPDGKIFSPRSWPHGAMTEGQVFSCRARPKLSQ